MANTWNVSPSEGVTNNNDGTFVFPENTGTTDIEYVVTYSSDSCNCTCEKKVVIKGEEKCDCDSLSVVFTDTAPYTAGDYTLVKYSGDCLTNLRASAVSEDDHSVAVGWITNIGVNADGTVSGTVTTNTVDSERKAWVIVAADECTSGVGKTFTQAENGCNCSNLTVSGSSCDSDSHSNIIVGSYTGDCLNNVKAIAMDGNIFPSGSIMEVDGNKFIYGIISANTDASPRTTTIKVTADECSTGKTFTFIQGGQEMTCDDLKLVGETIQAEGYIDTSISECNYNLGFYHNVNVYVDEAECDWLHGLHVDSCYIVADSFDTNDTGAERTATVYVTSEECSLTSFTVTQSRPTVECNITWINSAATCVTCDCDDTNFTFTSGDSITVPGSGFDGVVATVADCVDISGIIIYENTTSPWGITSSYDVDNNIYLTIPSTSTGSRSEGITFTVPAKCGTSFNKTITITQEAYVPPPTPTCDCIDIPSSTISLPQFVIPDTKYVVATYTDGCINTATTTVESMSSNPSILNDYGFENSGGTNVIYIKANKNDDDAERTEEFKIEDSDKPECIKTFTVEQAGSAPTPTSKKYDVNITNQNNYNVEIQEGYIEFDGGFRMPFTNYLEIQRNSSITIHDLLLDNSIEGVHITKVGFLGTTNFEAEYNCTTSTTITTSTWCTSAAAGDRLYDNDSLNIKLGTDTPNS